MEKIPSQNPIILEHPEVPYDHVLPYLNIAPIVNGEGQLKYTAALACRLARQVDEKWEISTQIVHSEAIDDLENSAQNDQNLAALTQTINQALSTFLQSRGV